MTVVLGNSYQSRFGLYGCHLIFLVCSNSFTPLRNGHMVRENPSKMAYNDDELGTAMRKVLPRAELNMDLRPILTTLDAEDLLNPYEYQDVNSTANRIEQTRKVFRYIRAKGPKYKEKFVEILGRPGSGTEHWAKEIRELSGVVEASTEETPCNLEPEEPKNRLGMYVVSRSQPYSSYT